MVCFVGRDAEIALLTSHLDETEAGRGGVVLISGEPGFGKSALLDEVRVRADTRGFAVIPVRCAPDCLPQADPPSSRIISNLSALASQTTVNRKCGSNISIIPTLPHIVTEGTLMEARSFCSNPPATESCASYRTLRQLFDMISRERALLLTLDDVHNADERLFALLRFAAHEFCNWRVLLVAAFCPNSGGAGASTIIEGIGQECRLFELTPFDRRATGELVAQIGGVAPDESAIYRIQELTGGNPALVMEAALYNARKERWDSALDFHPQVPATIRAIVMKKLALLSKEARALLRVASVIGETFKGQLLLNLVAPSEGARAALSESRAQGLVHRVDGDRYRFATGFTRKVLYQDLTLAERSSLHRQIATILETEKSQNFELAAGDVALHLLASQEPDAIGRAISLAELSAAHSARFGDHHGAVVMYSIALEAITLSGGSEDGRRCNLLTQMANSQEMTGDLGGAHESLHQAVALAERLGDWPRLAEVTLAAPLSNSPAPGAPNGLVIMLAEKLLAAPPESEPVRRALVMARLASELTNLRQERDRAPQLAAEAVAVFQQVEADERSRLKLLRLRDRCLTGPEAIQERLANSAQLIRIAYRQGDWVSLFEGEWAREISLFQLGTLDSADAGQQSLDHLANMAGCKYRWLAHAFNAVLSIFEGRFADGEALLEEAREMTAECGAADQTEQIWSVLIMPLDEQERLRELEEIAASCFRKHRNSAFFTAMWCLTALKLGKSSEARFYLDRLGAANFRDLRDSRALLAEAAALTQVCTELGGPPKYAELLYEMLLPYAGRNAVYGIAAAFGGVSRYLGKLALSLAHVDRAIDHFSDAVECNKNMGARPWAAYSAQELALALLARGHDTDRRLAFELLSNAHAEAVDMGMKRLAKCTSAARDRHEAAREETSIKTNGMQEGGAWALGASIDFHASMMTRAERSPFVEIAVGGDFEQHQRASFRFEGSYWTITYAGQVVRIKRLKGLNLIAYLLSRPNQEIHTLELAAIGGLEPGAAVNGLVRAASIDLGPVLDNTAKQSYRNRISDLREDLEEARSFNDFERAAQIEEELCVVTRELARAVGLGGRDRRPGSQVERSRLRVTSAIRWATSKISQQHPALGHFLAQTIRTGTSCAYVPNSELCPEWDIQM